MRCCGGRKDAHFGWCASVGGPGSHPSTRPAAVTAPAKARAPQATSRTTQRPRLQLVPSRPAITPGVNVYSQPRGEAPRRADQLLWVAVSGDVDWTKFDLPTTATKLHESCQRGLPRAITFGYHPDVLALTGVNVQELEAAVRTPTRVEIRPETGKKGYPILGFYRGDVSAILGMRQPTRPLVIAAYWTALLEHDTYRTPERSGGGGPRREGVPSTPTALVKRLTGLGACVGDEWHTSATATVTFRGQDLGKITCAPGTAKAKVQQDWQRCHRKVEAINRREASVS